MLAQCLELARCQEEATVVLLGGCVDLRVAERCGRAWVGCGEEALWGDGKGG